MTNAALDAAIAACGPGKKFSGIGRAIHEVLRGKDYSVCPIFTGHGIGREFHRRPWIYHTCGLSCNLRDDRWLTSADFSFSE